MAERQIFIVGTGRSGTTILRKILGHHSRVYAFAKELHFISDTNGLIDLAQTLSQNWNPFNASEAIVEFRDLVLNHLWQRRIHHYLLGALYMRVLNGTAHKYRALTFHNAIPREHCTAVVDTFVDEITLGKDSGYWYGSKSYQLNPTVYVTRQMEKIGRAHV